MGVIRKLAKGFRLNFSSLRYLINQERNSKSNLGLLKKVRYLRHGFSSSKYELYDFKKNNHQLYLSDFQRYKTKLINGQYSLIIDDKNLFSKLFNEYNVTTEVFGEVQNGKIMINERRASVDEFVRLLIGKHKIIIKKYRGGGGKGVYKVSSEKGSIYLDDKLISKEELVVFLNGLSNHLITEHLEQAEYSNAIYPGTINSIRILTMQNPITGEVFIPIAVHKFGSEATKPVDNVWKGGMTALIDLDTGKLGKSAYHFENNNKIKWLPTHPDTKKTIEGTQIPNWEEVKRKVIAVANVEKNLKYVGWDIVVTDNGIKVIEGNNYSDVNILQIHQALLKDDRVKQFYKYHNIVK